MSGSCMSDSIAEFDSDLKQSSKLVRDAKKLMSERPGTVSLSALLATRQRHSGKKWSFKSRTSGPSTLVRPQQFAKFSGGEKQKTGMFLCQFLSCIHALVLLPGYLWSCLDGVRQAEEPLMAFLCGVGD